VTVVRLSYSSFSSVPRATCKCKLQLHPANQVMGVLLEADVRNLQGILASTNRYSSAVPHDQSHGSGKRGAHNTSQRNSILVTQSLMADLSPLVDNPVYLRSGGSSDSLLKVNVPEKAVRLSELDAGHRKYNKIICFPVSYSHLTKSKPRNLILTITDC